MKAVAIHAHGDLDQVHLEDRPDPAPGPGEVLVRVHACGLNHLDLWVLKGMPGLPVDMPRIPGGDIAGEVEARGDGVSGWRPGDRVLVDPELGDDPAHNRVLGEHVDGGLCERIAVPAENLVRLPDAVSFVQAACLPVAYGTAWRMMGERGRVKAGERVLVLGASGGVGTACVQIGRLLDATVYAAAGSDEKLARLRDLGADHGINYAKEDFSRAAWHMTGKRGMDVIVNFTGGDTWVPSIRALARHGRLLTCGATAGYDPRTDIRYIWRREVTIVGCNSWERDDLTTLLDMVATGRLEPVVHATFPLCRARDAMAELRERRVIGKVIVVP